MPRQKMLNVGAREIQEFAVSFIREEAITGAVVDRILLEIKADGQLYAYVIANSRNHVNLEDAGKYIEDNLALAKEEFSKVKIHEDTDRTELTLEIQDMKPVVFNGVRLHNKRSSRGK